MGIGNAIKQQEQKQEQAQQSQGQGADIIGLLQQVQATLDESRKSAQEDRKAMQDTLDKVIKTAESLDKVQDTIASNTKNVSAVMQSAVQDIDKGMGNVTEQVKQLKVSQNEINQAVTLKQVVKRIEQEFEDSTRKTVQAAGKDLDKELAKVQERFRSPFQWIGEIDLKGFLTKSAGLYVAGIAAVIALIMTVLLIIVGTRQFWVWATTTTWFPVVAAVVLAAPAVLSVIAATKWLWSLVKAEE